ncbi:MAG: hypothetical protein ACRCUY_02585 [Thermoguttaceae bacterium]
MLLDYPLFYRFRQLGQLTTQFFNFSGTHLDDSWSAVLEYGTHFV